MKKETYQIKVCVHDEVVAFAGAMNPKGKLECNEDEMYSPDRYKLESCNPEDTIPVATFFMKSTLLKKHIFMSQHLQNHIGRKSLISIFALRYLVG